MLRFPRFPWSEYLVGLLCPLLLSAIAEVHAEDTPAYWVLMDPSIASPAPADPSAANSSSSGAYAFGDWDGGRERLADEGFLLRAHYGSESATAGSYGARYAQQIDVGADIDLDKVWGWAGSSFHATIGDRVGRNLSADRIHNLIQVQEIYGVGQDLRLYEMSYEYQTQGHGFDIKAGWMPLGNEFGHSDIACQFQSLYFCGHPVTMSFDSGWFNNPKASWGFRLKWSNPLVYAMWGAYTTNPTYPESNNGFKLNLSGTTGVVIPVEFGFTPGGGSGVMPGNYKVGAYLDTSDADNLYLDINGQPQALTGAAPRIEGHRSGYYIIADQMIWQDAGNLKRGLKLFADYSLGDKATGRYRRSYELGLAMMGVFASRPQDNLVLGIGRVTVNPNVIEGQREDNWILPGSIDVQSYEQVEELAYSWQVTKWFSIRPGVQHLDRPGALASRSDVWVGEFGLKLTF